MGYALAAPMSDLVACPFCRQLFEPTEASACPDCGLGLKDVAKLPPSYDAQVEYPEEPVPPHMETLPWTYTSRNRAILLFLSVAGLAAFFAPWVHETAPEIQVLSGYTLARMSGFFWAPAVAWFVLFPLVLTRRSIYKMRGARVAVGFLAGIVLVTVAMLLTHPPRSATLRPVHIEWGWGIYAAGAAALAAILASFGFGGRLDDIPTRRERRGDEVLH
jgi:magnesium-transporting ATPase (P-type)